MFTVKDLREMVSNIPECMDGVEVTWMNYEYGTIPKIDVTFEWKEVEPNG